MPAMEDSRLSLARLSGLRLTLNLRRHTMISQWVPALRRLPGPVTVTGESRSESESLRLRLAYLAWHASATARRHHVLSLNDAAPVMVLTPTTWSRGS